MRKLCAFGTILEYSVRILTPVYNALQDHLASPYSTVMRLWLCICLLQKSLAAVATKITSSSALSYQLSLSVFTYLFIYLHSISTLQANALINTVSFNVSVKKHLRATSVLGGTVKVSLRTSLEFHSSPVHGRYLLCPMPLLLLRTEDVRSPHLYCTCKCNSPHRLKAIAACVVDEGTFFCLFLSRNSRRVVCRRL